MSERKHPLIKGKSKYRGRKVKLPERQLPETIDDMLSNPPNPGKLKQQVFYQLVQQDRWFPEQIINQEIQLQKWKTKKRNPQYPAYEKLKRKISKMLYNSGNSHNDIDGHGEQWAISLYQDFVSRYGFCPSNKDYCTDIDRQGCSYDIISDDDDE